MNKHIIISFILLLPFLFAQSQTKIIDMHTLTQKVILADGSRQAIIMAIKVLLMQKHTGWQHLLHSKNGTL